MRRGHQATRYHNIDRYVTFFVQRREIELVGGLQRAVLGEEMADSIEGDELSTSLSQYAVSSHT